MSQRVSSKLTSRSSFSESSSMECSPYAETLANKLLSLHEENIEIGKQNQELSARLHEVTTYNQALGLDIYKLDNQINELEEKIDSHREKATKILHQTEIMNKKTEKCKNSLNRNEQMSELATKFQKISRFKEKADKNVQELQKLFEDPNYSKITNSFDLIAQKIHFLYWNNNELNEQISILERMVSVHEDEDRSNLQNSWEERRIDKQKSSQTSYTENGNKDENKSESPKGGASLRLSLKKRSRNTSTDQNTSKPNTPNSRNNEEDGECCASQAQSDASKKNEYFMSSGSMENEIQRKVQNKKIKPKSNNDNEHTPNQQEQQIIRSPVTEKSSLRKRRKGRFSTKNQKNINQNKDLSGSDNEYGINEYDNRTPTKQQSDSQKITPKKRQRSLRRLSFKNTSNGEEENEGEADNPNNEDAYPKSSSTTYSKSSSKSTHSDKSNHVQSPNSCQLNDTSSNLADSSNSNHSNKTDNNDDFQEVRLIHSNSKASMRNTNDGNSFYTNERRPSRRKGNISQKSSPNKDSDSEYDYYESEPPPNPKKGTKRISNKDPEYEYEYYDPDEENEEADDENEYDFVEESTAPPRVIIGKPKDAINRNNPQGNQKVITNYTEGEYHQLQITPAEKIEPNLDGAESIINLHPKHQKEEEEGDKSEYIYIKKSAKTIKEEEERARKRKFVPKIIIPKKTRDELRQEKNEALDEEQIKKHEENALKYALEDELIEKQKKIAEESKTKDEEELFLRNTLKSLKARRKKKRDKLEKMKDEELNSYRESKEYEKYYFNKVDEIIKMREEREMMKEIEEENETLIKEEFRIKAIKRIKEREKEEEIIKAQENLQKMTKKEAQEKEIEMKKIKARQLKEEEEKKLKDKENEENEIKRRERKRRETLLEETKLKEQQKSEEMKKKKEKEEKERQEKERIVIEEMARRKREQEEKEKKQKETEKMKKAKEIQTLKNKISKFREMKEKEILENEEDKNREEEVKLIKERLREKRRREREQREKERIEREKKEKELRELYDGIFDVPVKRIFDKKDEDKDDDDLCFKNSKLGNEKEGFLSDSGMMSNSDSISELDVAAAVSLEQEEKLANQHEKNSHSHSNCRRVRVKKGRKYKDGNKDEYEYEYDYEYEYEYESEEDSSKTKTNSNSKANSINDESESESESIIMRNKNKNSKERPIDESEAEKIAFQEQQQLQQMLHQMDNQNNKNKSKNKDKKGSSHDFSSTSRFESDSSIAEVSRKSGNNDSILNYNYDDENNKSNASEVIEYSDDDYFPRPKNAIKVRNNKKGDEDDDEEDSSNKHKHKGKNGKENNGLIIGNENRPLRKEKAAKPEFVPEYYNVKQRPKFKPVVVGIVHNKNKQTNNDKDSIPNMGKIVDKIDNPSSPKPVLIENCKIRHPKPVSMNMNDFVELKTKEQLQKEAEEKAAREERERLHAERAKKFRHSIDTNGKEYEYDYEYDYEYETENDKTNKKETDKEDETEKQSEDNDNKNKANNSKEGNDNSNEVHATYRDSTNFVNELSNEVDNANQVVKQTTNVLLHREEEEENEKKKTNMKFIMKDGVLVEEEEETNEPDSAHKERTKVKKVRTGRKIKKSPSTISTSNENNNQAGIKKQRSVTFVNNPGDEVNFKPPDNNLSRTPQKRIINSARRQRNSPSSPVGDSSTSPNSKQRLSTRRLFRDTSGDNNEEEDVIFDEIDEEDEERLLQSASKNNNLLVEIDSRPVTPRKPPRPSSKTSPNKEESNEAKSNEEAIANVPGLDLKNIQDTKAFQFNDYEYEYEYEYDNQDIKNGKIDSPSVHSVHFKIQNNEEDDFTENEKAFDSRSYFKLHDLVKKVRADAALTLSNEDLKELLVKINAEIDSQQKSNEKLQEKLNELEKIRDHKIPKNLSLHNETNQVSFEPVDFSANFIVQTIQTEMTNEFIDEIEVTLVKQSNEKEEMNAVQKRIEAAQQQVVTMDNQIKTAEKLTVEKKQSIETLKGEIIKVKEEIAQLNYDTTKDDEQAKQCEVEIEKLEVQVKQSQQKLEKVSHTIEELQFKLQEMINYRAVLEAELNDMYNREKPEVRKLIEDVRNSKQSSEEATAKIAQLQKRITSRRVELNKLKNSQDKKKNDDLKLMKEKLSRRLNKWTKLNSSENLNMQSINEFSVSKAAQREKAKNEAYKNMRNSWAKDEEVESLTKYANLLESLWTEYNKQTSA